MHPMWPESASHSWADLELQSCHHQNYDRPRSRSCHLHSTTWQKLVALLPSLLVAQWLWGDLPLGARQLGGTGLDQPGRAPLQWQAWGSLVQTTSAPNVSSPQLWRTLQWTGFSAFHSARLRQLATLKCKDLAQRRHPLCWPRTSWTPWAPSGPWPKRSTDG